MKLPITLTTQLLSQPLNRLKRRFDPPVAEKTQTAKSLDEKKLLYSAVEFRHLSSQAAAMANNLLANKQSPVLNQDEWIGWYDLQARLAESAANRLEGLSEKEAAFRQHQNRNRRFHPYNPTYAIVRDVFEPLTKMLVPRLKPLPQFKQFPSDKHEPS